MSIYLYFEPDATDAQIHKAREFLVGLGYKQHPTMDTSYLGKKDIITLGPDKHLIQLNFNDDNVKYQERYQHIIDEFRRIFRVSSYATDFDQPCELNLEGLVRKK